MKTPNYGQQISWIYNPDYIPEDKSYYEAWPEPYRKEALEALKDREQNFDQWTKDELAKYE